MGAFDLNAFSTVCAAGVIEDPSKGYQEGDRFFYFPGDGDGILHLVDAEEPVDTAFIEEYTRNPDNNAYWLFTRYATSYELDEFEIKCNLLKLDAIDNAQCI